MDFKQYLAYFGLSQAEFAREVDVTPDTVSRWKGKPPKMAMLYLEWKFKHDEMAKAGAFFRSHPEVLVECFRKYGDNQMCRDKYGGKS